MILDLFLLALAILLLWKGADHLVETAGRLGRRVGLSDLTIGLTIVAFGTSAPEFAVTISAAINGQADVSVGNIVGSNIFNLGFVLGGCALFGGLRVARASVYRDGVLLVGSSLVLLLLLRDLRLSPWEGGLLATALILYLVFLARGSGAPDPDLPKGEASWRDVVILLLAVAAVGGGGHLLVMSASSLAQAFGLSEWVISVTVVAAGTSAPEVATSLVAAARGRHSMSIGNLLGSDLFNLLGVLGLAGLIGGGMQVSSGALSSVGMLVGMCGLVLLFMRTGWRLTPWEGAALIAVGAIRWAVDFGVPG